ncbi:PREDICTED: protein toll-like [Rhagoletis zephyria]|uniref:protein toll-like n=1 Tax=Rhagoletis zephyria TaxID=28612 RepID=UPI0008116BC8|nr:PREDICTED: protein toll-like [Rhagoletis zephyria]
MGFDCQLKDKFSLVTVKAKTWQNDDHAEVYKLNITCVYQPKDLDVVLAEMPQILLYKHTKFYLRNCFQFPALLRQPNVSYEGSVEFDPYLDASEDFFQHSSSLEHLILPVKFTYVDEPLPAKLLHNLTNLKSLQIIAYTAYPKISWPVELLHSLYNLERLSLEMVALHTSLQAMNSAHFRDLRALKKLKLDKNYMMTLPEDLFSKLPALNRLSLQLNGLTELPKNLLCMQRKLVSLDLSSNRLTTLPTGLFANTPLLWELALAGNRLSVPSNIIENVHALSYLYRLDLDGNHFETIWGAGNYRNLSIFARAHRADPYALSNLIAMGYDGERKPDVDKPLNYTFISLRANKLSHFSLDWIAEAGVHCPYFFDLALNEIRNVNAILRPPTFTCLHEVHLKGNPLVCDCKLAWVYHTDMLVNTDYWTCASPVHLAESGLQGLQRADLCDWSPAWCPEKCTCTRQAEVLLINCQRAHLQGLTQLPRPEQLSLAESTLYLEGNLFRQLPSNGTFGYANVTRLYAAHNRLNIVLPAHLPPSLTVLDLRANHLERLSAGFLRSYLNGSETLTELYLSENPWLCDCETELLLYTLRAQSARIPDAGDMYCANFPNVTLLNVIFNDVCVLPTSSLGLMTRLIAIFLTILLLLSLVTLYYKYELEVKIWLHAHNLTPVCFSIDDLDNDKTFDAFISYSHKDKCYVNNTLLPQLEHGDPPFRICTHERNWLAGAYIPEQIVESVAQSRRTIIVLSQHFVESDWGRMEFKTAHQCAINEKRARIIIIKYGEITNTAGLDSELEAYLRMNTYLDSEDPRFWQKLRYAMPHKRGEGRKAGMLEVSGRIYVSGQVELNQLKSEREEK